MTVAQRILRVRCWLRGYHSTSRGIGQYVGCFRYDVDGICAYCGKVGTGVEPDGE